MIRAWVVSNCATSISSAAKIQRIRDYGADLVVGGERYADALGASEAWAQASGALPIHAYDQAETILGQGTLGMEIDAQAHALDALLVPVGGGGLIAGIAAWHSGATRVIGVEPEASPTLAKALEAGRPVDAPAGGIAADSLAPRRVGDLVFPIARRFVERVVLVSDDAILAAQQLADREGNPEILREHDGRRFRPAGKAAERLTPSTRGNTARIARRAPQQPLFAPLRHFDGGSERLVIAALHAREIRTNERDRQQRRDQMLRQFAQRISDLVEMAAGQLAQVGKRGAHADI